MSWIVALDELIHLTFLTLVSVVPKEGLTDAQWRGIMILYAKGRHRFAPGTHPRKRQWVATLDRIKKCPMTPKTFNAPVNYRDMFGKKINCTCGYHAVSNIHSFSFKVY